MGKDTQIKLMLLCMTEALHSSCSKRKVGSLILIDGVVIARGYNKHPVSCPGRSLCTNSGANSCNSTTHAEMMALFEASALLNYYKYHIQADYNVEIFCTISPCLECFRELVGIENLTKIYYYNQYGDFDEVLSESLETNIRLIQVPVEGVHIHTYMDNLMLKAGGKVDENS